MEAVMMSVKPEWCVKIASGEKTIEWRKSHPTRTSGPFKVYIYCTSVKRLNLETYVDLHRKTSGAIDDWGGKVIGEFMCYGFYPVQPGEAIGQLAEKRGCVPAEDLRNYFGKVHGYGWNIAELKIYDKPLPLRRFKPDFETHEYYHPPLTRPPQSWRYVEELK